jgi:hypothetical protein
VAAVSLGSTLVLDGCRDEPTVAPTPFVVEQTVPAPITSTVGRPVAVSPTFVVRTADGRLLANSPVTVAVTAGKGTLEDAPWRTGVGPTPVGTWTLDTLAGLNALTILAEPARPITIEILGVPDTPAAIRVVGGGQSGFAGDLLAQQLRVDVVDRYGNAIPGLNVELRVAEGDGEISPASITTAGASGAGGVGGVTWRLGRLGGTQRVVASSGTVSATIEANIRSDYSPQVRFHGAVPDAGIQAAFLKAGERIHALVTGDISDVPVLNFDLARCGLQGATLSELVDDVVIYAVVTPIDGTGKILASATACLVRTQSRFPVIGVMRFDSDDIGQLIANGRLEAVVLHEMLHVLGIGTSWRSRNLVIGSGTSDPRFLGPRAADHCVALGGAMDCSNLTVPLENIGGSGTAEVHWRESTFDSELMTGFVETGAVMPLSSMSVASLEDIGFVVNHLAADPYRVPEPPGVAPRLAPTLSAPWETVLPPLFEVTSAGWVRPLRAK